jgi:menaquinone-specific isochorismate synthase
VTALPSGPPIDPFALAGQDGMLFIAGDRIRVGLGTGISFDLPDGLDSVGDIDNVTRTLAAVEVDGHPDEPGAGGSASRAVVAFGALPFERNAPARLVVPELLYACEPDGSEWVTVLSGGPFDGADRHSGALDDHVGLSDDPASLRAWLADRARRDTPVDAVQVQVPTPEPDQAPLIVARVDDGTFTGTVEAALRSIALGDLAKVVLARQVDVTMASPIGVVPLLRRWHGLEPNCAIFSVPTADGQFLGASPELLVERTGVEVRSRPLAGTTGRGPGESGTGRPAELLRSGKDRVEHRLVVEGIEQALAPLCSTLVVPAGPDLVHLHTITHLGTTLVGTLTSSGDRPVPGALDLVAALHPTPAVGGSPAREAQELIGRLEPEPRGHYAGPVGIVDAAGNGTWMVGIRAISVRGSSARLAAGVGIVAGSEPQAELEETTLKLTAAFEALAPGATFSTARSADAEPLDRPSRAVG